MVLAPSLLQKSSMTKKRIKFGLVILGLTAFLLALLALVFVPTGASAGKGPAFGQDQDGGGHSNHSSLAYFAPPNGHGPGNNPNSSNDGGAGPCAGTPNPCDNHDDATRGGWGHDADGQGGQGGGQSGGQSGGQGAGQDGGQGNGHSSDNGSAGPGGYGNSGPFAGYPGGGSGAPQDQSNCSSKKDKDEDSSDKHSNDKSCNSDDDSGNKDGSGNNSDNNGSNGGDDAGRPQFFAQDDKGPSDDTDDGSPDDTSGNPPNNPINNLVDNDPPSGDGTDEGLPPIDPNCFVETCDTHGGNPPNTDLTDPPAEVPEPLTLSLFAVGLTGVAALRRRQKTAAQPE